MSDSSTTAIHPVATAFKKCHFTCVYCGFDGRTYDGWMQLSVDHVRPKNSGGDDRPENLVAACCSCNSITSRMTFDESVSLKEIVAQKRKRVAESRKGSYEQWLEQVAPHFLQRPLPEVL